MSRIGTVLLVALASACAPGTSTLTLSLSTDLPIPTVAQLQITCTDDAGEVASLLVPEAGDTPLTRTLAIVFEADVRGAVQVQIDALDASMRVLVRGRATVQIAPSQSVGAAVSLVPVAGVRVNVNGQAYDGLESPGHWAADPGVGGVCDGKAYTLHGPISGTIDDALYVSQMYDDKIHCAVGGGSIAPGLHTVRLYFAELYFGPGCGDATNGGLGQRVFDIDLEGLRVLDAFDIFAEGRCAADPNDPNARPVIKTFAGVMIADGTLDVLLQTRIAQPLIDAIEVLDE